MSRDRLTEIAALLACDDDDLLEAVRLLLVEREVERARRKALALAAQDFATALAAATGAW